MKTRRRNSPSRAHGASRLGTGALVVAMVALGVMLRATLPPVRMFTPDEQTYATLAASFASAGFSRYPRVMSDYRADPGLVELPPPTRAGYFALAALAMRTTGQSSPMTLALLSTLSSMLILTLASFATWRWFGAPAALVTALLLAVSPLDLAIARRGWQDDVLALFAVAMLIALLARAESGGREATRGEREATRARPALIAFCACGAAALLVKETAIGLVLLGAAPLAVWSWRDGGARALAVTMAACALALGLALAVLATAAGGVGALFATLAAALRGQAHSPYTLQYQSGGPLYYARGLAILQPFEALLAGIGAAVALARPRWLAGDASSDSARRLFALAFWTAGFALVSAFYPVKNLRFLSPIYASGAMLAGIAVASALRAARAGLSPAGLRMATIASVAALLAIAALDLRRFFDLFVLRGIPDLATPWFK